MKLWVDDERSTPKGWCSARTAAFAIYILDHRNVEEVSLDHDLGDTYHDPEWTGYTVLRHIEDRVAFDLNYYAPVIHIHTDNPPGREKMKAAVENIERLMQAKMALEK